MCSATFSIPFKASVRTKHQREIQSDYVDYVVVDPIFRSAVCSIELYLPTKCKCSSQRGSVRFRNCCNSSGYFNILWIGFIKYDSRVLLCCCFGFLAMRNSCNAWFPSSETKIWRRSYWEHKSLCKDNECTYSDAEPFGPCCDWRKTMNTAWNGWHSTKRPIQLKITHSGIDQTDN